MLQHNSLYKPVVIELSSTVGPNEEFFGSNNITHDKIKDRCKTFYGGIIVSQLATISASELSTLKVESKNWNLDTPVTPLPMSINQVEISNLSNVIASLTTEVRTLKFQTNNNKLELPSGGKTTCSICMRSHTVLAHVVSTRLTSVKRSHVKAKV